MHSLKTASMILMIALTWLSGLCASSAMATGIDLVTVRSSQLADRGRLLIEWSSPVKVLQKQEGDQLTLRFSRPLSINVARALGSLASYLNIEQSRAEAADLILNLKPGTTTKLKVKKNRSITVDFMREQQKDQDVALGVSSLNNGIRLQIEWPQAIDFKADQEEGSLRIAVNAPFGVKAADLAFLNETLQPWFKEVRQTQGAANLSLDFTLSPLVVASTRRIGGQSLEISLTRDAATAVLKPKARPTPIKEASSKASKPWPPRPEARPPNHDEDISANPSIAEMSPPASDNSPKVDKLAFLWEGDVGTAVFKRAGYLWVIFDAPRTALRSPLPPPVPATLMPGTLLEVDDATILHFQIKQDTNFDVRRDDSGGWFVHPVEDPVPTTPVSIEYGYAKGTLRANASSSGRIIDLQDPIVGDQLSILPLQQAALGQPTRRRFVDLDIIPSWQGLVWRPLNDKLSVIATKDDIEFGSQQGLALSAWPNDRAADDSTEPPLDWFSDQEGETVVKRRTFDDERQTDEQPPSTIANSKKNDQASPRSYLQLAGSGVDRNLVAETRRVLRQAIAKSKPDKRDQRRLDLAKLLIAERFASEAKIVLQAISDQDQGNTAKSRRALIGAAAFLTGDLDEATALLDASEFDEDTEIGIWRSALQARDGDWQTSAEGWKASDKKLNAYPPKLLFEFGLLALEAAIKTHDDNMIRKGFRRLRPLELKPHETAQLERLHALRAIHDGDLEKAKQILSALIDDQDSNIGIVADFELASLLRSENPDNLSLLATLNDRLPLWRGHPKEVDMIDHLAREYQEKDEAREALRLWEYLSRIHPKTENDPAIRDNRRDTYARALTVLAGDKIDLIDAYAIYLDFTNLLPEDPDDRLIHRRLAQHLEGLDLIDEAIRTLEPLLEGTTEKTELKEIGAELAKLLLLENRASEALSALERSGPGPATPTTPIETERLLLTARALGALERVDEALSAIQDLRTIEAHRLRARLFWQQRNWNRLAAAVGSVLDTSDLPSPLSDQDQQLVLWLALSRERLGQTEDLDELRQRYAADMAGGPWSRAFVVATQAASRRGDIASILSHADQQLTELGAFRDDTIANP